MGKKVIDTPHSMGAPAVRYHLGKQYVRPMKPIKPGGPSSVTYDGVNITSVDMWMFSSITASSHK